jgi:hypothetical protein
MVYVIVYVPAELEDGDICPNETKSNPEFGLALKVPPGVPTITGNGFVVSF